MSESAQVVTAHPSYHRCSNPAVIFRLQLVYFLSLSTRSVHLRAAKRDRRSGSGREPLGWRPKASCVSASRTPLFTRNSRPPFPGHAIMVRTAELTAKWRWHLSDIWLWCLRGALTLVIFWSLTAIMVGGRTEGE